jgi:hypothetical protein
LKQLNNGYYEGYYLETDGRLYNKSTDTYLTIDNKHSYRLKTNDGRTKRVALKTLYKLVFNKPYCIDTIDSLPDEEWKEIEGTEGNYYISNLGRIKSYKGYKALLMTPYLTAGGYERVDVIIDNTRVSKLVHRLTASAFLPVPKDIDMVLRHKDNNKRNNSAVNLEWLTHRQHIQKHYPKETENNE